MKYGKNMDIGQPNHVYINLTMVQIFIAMNCIKCKFIVELDECAGIYRLVCDCKFSV